MRKILITNDDGIEANGIIRLAGAAAKYGEVWVVAPKTQRSGASHSINLHTPINVLEAAFPVQGVRAFAASGSPADCVRVGVLNIVPGKPDIVLSGINYGYNAGTDVMYSGTIGAAMEAVFQGIPAIAFSEGTKVGSEVTDKYLDEILGQFIETAYRRKEVVNINFPDCRLSELEGILYNRTVSHSCVYKDSYKCTLLPDGTRDYMVDGTYQEVAEEGSDLRALFDNYISIGTVTDIG